MAELKGPREEPVIAPLSASYSVDNGVYRKQTVKQTKAPAKAQRIQSFLCNLHARNILSSGPKLYGMGLARLLFHGLPLSGGHGFYPFPFDHTKRSGETRLSRPGFLCYFQPPA
jgi:hypothetical protein